MKENLLKLLAVLRTQDARIQYSSVATGNSSSTIIVRTRPNSSSYMTEVLQQYYECTVIGPGMISVHSVRNEDLIFEKIGLSTPSSIKAYIDSKYQELLNLINASGGDSANPETTEDSNTPETTEDVNP